MDTRDYVLGDSSVYGGATGLLIAPHAITLMASSFLRGVHCYSVTFSVPLFLVMLNLFGLVSSQGLLRGWRVAVVAAAALSMLRRRRVRFDGGTRGGSLHEKSPADH